MAWKVIRNILLLALLTSCYHKQQESSFNPDLVMPPDKMVAVLVDIHLVDGALGTKQRQGADMKELSGPYLDFVLEKHQITREMLDESTRYYAYHMEEYSGIYEKVLDELGKIQSLERSRKPEGQDTIR